MIWETYHTVGITEKYLYKFLSHTDAKRMFESGAIWFSRADVFGDKMECVLIQELRTDKFNLEKLKIRQSKFLISCWHLANRETVVMWDTYADEPSKRKNIAIRFKKNDLINLMSECLFRNNQDFHYLTKFVYGRIAYKNLIGQREDQVLKSTTKEPALRKESAYSYEKEFRFVIKLRSKYPQKGYPFRLDDSQNLPFKIIVNPLLEDEHFVELNGKIKDGLFGDKLIASSLVRWLKPHLL